MKLISIICLLMLAMNLLAQQPLKSPMDGRNYGVVMEHPDMKKVQLTSNVTFLKDDKGELKIDIYTPPGLKNGEKRAVVVFLNAIGETPGQIRVKNWGVYSSWPRLMAANGFIGISMESDGTRIQESLAGLFDFIAKQGASHKMDKDRIGVYAASANVTQSVRYLMDQKASSGIKSAVLYYGRPPEGPFRKDLPVLFVISEGDVGRSGYTNLWTEVLKNNAPWTIRMGTGMPHAFDVFADNDESRKIIKETIDFWKTHLEPIARPAWEPSKGREVLGVQGTDPARALVLLESLTKEYPNDENTFIFYADILKRSNKNAEAEAAYKQVLKLNPKNSNALVKLAELMYILDKEKEAEEYITTATNAGVITANSYSQLAFGLLVAGKDAKAAEYFEKALSTQPRGFDYYNMACAYAKINNVEKAVAALNKAIEYRYPTREQIESDTDFNLVKNDERFKKVLEGMK